MTEQINLLKKRIQELRLFRLQYAGEIDKQTDLKIEQIDQELQTTIRFRILYNMAKELLKIR